MINPSIHRKLIRNRITIFLISLLMPGLGYLKIGEIKKFIFTIVLFYTILISGVVFGFYSAFAGFVSILLSLSIAHLGSATHAALKTKVVRPSRTNRFLMLALTLFFILLTGTGFSNSRTLMGFDRVSMAVPVMEPSIRKGEQVLVDTWIYKRETPQRGDIIIHSFPGQPGIYLNRIIAVGGDKIEIHEGKTFINGILSTERYVNPENAGSEVSIKMELLTVPSNHYFVMGDNRDKSLGDSRFSGTIDLSEITGKITCILYSENISRIGTKFE